MANETKPLFHPAHQVTVRATANVTGCRLVAITASYDGNFPVAHATAGVKPFGVAAANLDTGQLGAVLRAGIVPVTAGATVTAGQQVESDSQGRIIPLATGRPVGLAVETGTINTLVQIALSIA